MEALSSSFGRLSLINRESCVLVRELHHAENSLLHQETQLAIDAEGVHLGRHGRVSIVQIATKAGKCYLFDVVGLNHASSLIRYLKQLLENNAILKIIHDCRIDADALYHHFDISLVNVIDTQECELMLDDSNVRSNLNITLAAHGLPVNATRDARVYENNATYWETRPMTNHMIEWASEDVLKLHALYASQRRRLHRRGCLSDALQRSEEATRVLKDCNTLLTRINKSQAGRFIGKGGCNIRNLEVHTGCLFYFRGKEGELVVYAPDSAALRKAKNRLKRYQKDDSI